MTAPGLSLTAAFMCWGFSPTRELAEFYAREAARLGATPEQLAEAWVKWDAIEAASVQVVRSTGGAL